jgi:hypothetical protein
LLPVLLVSYLRNLCQTWKFLAAPQWFQSTIKMEQCLSNFDVCLVPWNPVKVHVLIYWVWDGAQDSACQEHFTDVLQALRGEDRDWPAPLLSFLTINASQSIIKIVHLLSSSFQLVLSSPSGCVWDTFGMKCKGHLSPAPPPGRGIYWSIHAGSI